MNIKRRIVKHKPNRDGYRGFVIYDWRSELFWGGACTPAEARLQNTAYMNRKKTTGWPERRPDYRKAQLAHNRWPMKQIIERLSAPANDSVQGKETQ